MKPISYPAKLRMISACIIILFSVNTVFGSVPFPLPSVIDSKPMSVGIEIPDSYGKISEVFPVPTGSVRSSCPRIVLIQDAHGNLEAQKNIEKLLGYLNLRYGIKQLWLEGASGTLDRWRFQISESRELNEKAWEMLFEKGVLSGADRYLLTSDFAMNAQGAEDRDLYIRDLAAFRDVMSLKENSGRLIDTLRARLDLVSSHVAKKELREFLQDWWKFEKGGETLSAFCGEVIEHAAQAAEIDLGDFRRQTEWPQLTRMSALREAGENLDSEKVAGQKAEFLEKMKEKAVTEELLTAIENWDGKTCLRSLFERLYDQAGMSGIAHADYPEFFEWAGFEILKQEMNGEALYAELKRMSDIILKVMSGTEDEKIVVALYRRLNLMSRMLHLELTRNEWNIAKKEAGRLSPASFAKRLNGLSKDLSVRIRPILERKMKSEEENYRNALKFYVLAQKRDRQLIGKALDRIRNSGQERAVLIAGGFHAEGMSAILKEKGIAFAGIQPSIRKEADQSLYFNRMMRVENEFTASQISAPDPLQSDALLGQIPGELPYIAGQMRKVRAALGIPVHEAGGGFARRTAISASLGAVDLFDNPFFTELRAQIPAEAFESLRADILADEMMLGILRDPKAFEFPRHADVFPAAIRWSEAGERLAFCMTLLASGARNREESAKGAASRKKGHGAYWGHYRELKNWLSGRELPESESIEMEHYRRAGDELIRNTIGMEDADWQDFPDGYLKEYEIPLGGDRYLVVMGLTRRGWRGDTERVEAYFTEKTAAGYRMISKLDPLRSSAEWFELSDSMKYCDALAGEMERLDDSAGFADAVRKYFTDGVWIGMGFYGDWDEGGRTGAVLGRREVMGVHDRIEYANSADEIMKGFEEAFAKLRKRIPFLSTLPENEGIRFLAWAYLDTGEAMRFKRGGFIPLGADAYRRFRDEGVRIRPDQTEEDSLFEIMNNSQDLWEPVREQYSGRKPEDAIKGILRHVDLIRNLGDAGGDMMELLAFWRKTFSPENYDSLVSDVLASAQRIRKALEKRNDALQTPEEITREILIALGLLSAGDVLSGSPAERALWGDLLLAYFSRPDVSIESLKKQSSDKDRESIARALQKLVQSVMRFEATAASRGWPEIGLRRTVISWVGAEGLDRKAMNLLAFYPDHFLQDPGELPGEWLAAIAGGKPGVDTLLAAAPYLGEKSLALSALFEAANAFTAEGWKDPHVLEDLLEGNGLDELMELYSMAEYEGGAADVRAVFLRHLERHKHYWKNWIEKFVDYLKKFRADLTQERIDAERISLLEQADLAEFMEIDEFRKTFGAERAVEGLRMGRRLRDPASGLIYEEGNDDHRVALFSVVFMELRSMGRLPGGKEKEAQGIDYADYFRQVFLKQGQANRRDQYHLTDVLMPRGFQWAPRGVILGLLALFNEKKAVNLDKAAEIAGQSPAIPLEEENLDNGEMRAMGLAMWAAGIAKNAGMTTVADDLFFRQADEFLSLPQSRRFLDGEIDRKVARNLFGDTQSAPTPLDSSRSYYLNGSGGLFYFYRYFPGPMKEWMTGFMSNGLNEERLRPHLTLFERLAAEDVLTELTGNPALNEKLNAMDSASLIGFFSALNLRALSRNNANFRKAEGEALWMSADETAKVLDSVDEIRAGGAVDYQDPQSAEALYFLLAMNDRKIDGRTFDAGIRNLFSFKDPAMNRVMNDYLNEADPAAKEKIIESFAKQPLAISARIEQDFAEEYRKAEGNAPLRREMLEALMSYRYFGKIFYPEDDRDSGFDDHWGPPWMIIGRLEREYGVRSLPAFYRKSGDLLIPEKSFRGVLGMGMMGGPFMMKPGQLGDGEFRSVTLEFPLPGGRKVVVLQDDDERRFEVCLVEERGDGAMTVVRESSEEIHRGSRRGAKSGWGMQSDYFYDRMTGGPWDEDAILSAAAMIAKEGYDPGEMMGKILCHGYDGIECLEIDRDGQIRHQMLAKINRWDMGDDWMEFVGPGKRSSPKRNLAEGLRESLRPVREALEQEFRQWLTELSEEERSGYLDLAVMRTLLGMGQSAVISKESIRRFAAEIRGEMAPAEDPIPTVRSFVAAREAVREGRFDPDNRDHRYANFIALQQQLENSTMRREIPWEEYLSIVERGKAGKASPADQKITEEQRMEVRGLVYEAVLMWEKIREIQAGTERPVVVVENLSYGAVATSPITEERNGTKYIIGTDIPVISTKIGSTECHNDEFYTRKDLFTETEREYFLSQKPVVIVVDASTSVSDPERTSPHIPDGFKGYRNYFMALDQAQGIDIDPAAFHEDSAFMEGLAKDERNRGIVEMMREERVTPETSEPYRLCFWYPGDKQLYLRVGKKVATPAPRLQDGEALTGPALIFLQSAIDVESVGKYPRYEFVAKWKGLKHHPAHFDDKDHFKEFYLDYENGNGVVMSRAFINIARRYFKEFMELYGSGREPLEAEVAPPPMREIDTVVLDLDETVVKTDKPLKDNPEMLSTLIALVKKGKKLVLITEDLEKNLDARLEDLITAVPGDLLSNITVFSDGGTKGYTFAADRSKVYIEEHNAKSRISPELRTRMLDLLGGSELAGTYELDKRPERISREYRIDLRNVKIDRNEFIAKATRILREAGINAKVYKTGRTSIKIVLQHKEHALKYRVESEGIDPARMLVVGDSARMNQVDREMLAAYPESVSVTVGRFATTISKENPNIVQLSDEGIAGTQRLLGLLNLQGALPGWLIAPTGGKPIIESHIEGKDAKSKTGRQGSSGQSLGAQELAKEFEKRFPENDEMMLAMFGEILIENPMLKPFFDRIMACFKGPVHEEKAVYLTSLLRIEKSGWFEDSIESLGYEDEAEFGKVSWDTVPYEELDEEFLNWAVKRDIPLCDFSVAYSHFLRMKREQKASGNVTPIRPGRKLGEELERAVAEHSEAPVKTPLTMYKGDFNRPGMQFVKLRQDEALRTIAETRNIDLSDISVGVSKQDGEYQIYLFTRDPETVRKTEVIAHRDVGDRVAAVFAEVRIEHGVPFVHIFQPWIYVYHAETGELKELDRYVDGAMEILMHLLQNQISDLLQSGEDYRKIWFATPAWHMIRTHIAETTAQRHYWKIPRKEGFRVKALDEPIVLGGHWNINFVLQKEEESMGSSLGAPDGQKYAAMDLDDLLKSLDSIEGNSRYDLRRFHGIGRALWERVIVNHPSGMHARDEVAIRSMGRPVLHALDRVKGGSRAANDTRKILAMILEHYAAVIDSSDELRTIIDPLIAALGNIEGFSWAARQARESILKTLNRIGKELGESAKAEFIPLIIEKSFPVSNSRNANSRETLEGGNVLSLLAKEADESTLRAMRDLLLDALGRIRGVSGNAVYKRWRIEDVLSVIAARIDREELSPMLPGIFDVLKLYRGKKKILRLYSEHYYQLLVTIAGRISEPEYSEVLQFAMDNIPEEETNTLGADFACVYLAREADLLLEGERAWEIRDLIKKNVRAGGRREKIRDILMNPDADRIISQLRGYQEQLENEEERFQSNSGGDQGSEMNSGDLWSVVSAASLGAEERELARLAGDDKGVVIVNILGQEHAFDASIWNGISFADLSDAEAIYELSRHLELEGGVPALSGKKAVENLIRTRETVSGEENVFMVYREDGRVAGYLLAAIVRETGLGRILQIAVKPGSRRRGIGYALNGKFMHYAGKDLGIIRFLRYPIHEATKRMSARFGFELVAGDDVPAFVRNQKIYAVNAEREAIIRQAMRDQVSGTLELLQRAVISGRISEVEKIIQSMISVWIQVNHAYLRDEPMRVFNQLRRVHPGLEQWLDHPYFPRIQELLSQISMKDLPWVRDVEGVEVPGFDPAGDLIDAGTRYCVRGEEMREEAYQAVRAGELSPLVRYWYLKLFNEGKDFGVTEVGVRIEGSPAGIRVTKGRDEIVVRGQDIDFYVNGASLGELPGAGKHQKRLEKFLERTYRAQIDDIDGNLTEDGSDWPTEGVVEAIQRRILAGIPSGIASGRVERVASPDFRARGVHDIEDVAELVRAGLSPEAMPRFVTFPENASYATWMEWDEGQQEYVRKEVDLCKKYGIVPPEFEFTTKERDEIYREMGELMEKDLPNAFKLREDKRYGFAAWVNGNPEWSTEDLRAFVNKTAERIQSRLRSHPNPKFHMFEVVTTGITVDVMARGVDKSLALRFFAEKFGLEEGEIIGADDKGGKRGNGWPLTRHAAGVSTNEFNEESHHQVSLKAAWGMVGGEAWLRLQNLVKFESPLASSLGKTDIQGRLLPGGESVPSRLREILPTLNGGASAWAEMMTAVTPCRGFIRPDYPQEVSDEMVRALEPLLGRLSGSLAFANERVSAATDDAIVRFNDNPEWLREYWNPAGAQEELTKKSVLMLDEKMLENADDALLRSFADVLKTGDAVMVFWDGAGKRVGSVSKPASISALINLLNPRGVRVIDIPTLSPAREEIMRRLPRGLKQGVFVSTRKELFDGINLEIQCEKFVLDQKEFARSGIRPLQAVRLLKEIASVADEFRRLQRYYEIGSQKNGDYWVLDAEGLAGFIRSTYAAWQARQQISAAA